MSLKMYGLGPRSYFRSSFNCFDFGVSKTLTEPPSGESELCIAFSLTYFRWAELCDPGCARRLHRHWEEVAVEGGLSSLCLVARMSAAAFPKAMPFPP